MIELGTKRWYFGEQRFSHTEERTLHGFLWWQPTTCKVDVMKDVYETQADVLKAANEWIRTNGVTNIVSFVNTCRSQRYVDEYGVEEKKVGYIEIAYTFAASAAALR